MSLPDPEVLNSVISRFFNITDITAGDTQDAFLLRYRGQMTTDDIPAAYDLLAQTLLPYRATPLFRKDEQDVHIIYLVDGVIEPKPANVTVNIILLVLTIFSVMISGAEAPANMPSDTAGQMLAIAKNIFTGWPFALALLSILGAHELGHYFAGRIHKTAVTLPYFIPLPFSLLGTMGAFIQLKDLPKNKRHLLDIGIAGPLSGLIVAIPVLLIGLSLSRLGPVQQTSGGFIEGNSLLYLGAKYLVFGQLLPAPASYEGLSPLLYWLRYFFTGTPIPYGGTDVFIHPVALAGWAGILVTALNLIPAGQLDGGHIMYVLFGKRLRFALPIIIGLLVVLGFVWTGWWVWVGLLLLFGRTYAEPLDQITELDPRRRKLAYLAIFIFFLVLAPVPIITM
jgi:membrane-associated protease RseP (regulator of RpoE activity)